MTIPRITASTRWLYGTGGLGFGILETGIYNFVLIYYNQVLGLSASLTGFALAVALVFDEIEDLAPVFRFLLVELQPCAPSLAVQPGIIEQPEQSWDISNIRR